MTSESKVAKADLTAFLDYLGDKGLMNASTVSSRKAAVNTLLGVLAPEELQDVTALKLDDVAVRFLNKRGSEFKPDSVKVYKSRVASAIDDFKKYRADPLNFKVAMTPKPTVKSDKSSPPSKPAAFAGSPAPAHIEAFVSPSEIVFPIPIRPNVVVKIVGLPSDLTESEATRIANVVHALAAVKEP